MQAGGTRRSLAGKSDARRAEARRRRAEASWVAWAFEEFLRHFYAIGILAILLLVPLQMGQSWLTGRPVLPLAVVAIFAVAFDTAALYLGMYGYQLLWRDGGIVERLIARLEGRVK